MRVKMIEAGNVGLVCGDCFEDLGYTLTRVDMDPGKIDLDRVRKLLKSPVTFDRLDVYQPSDPARRGFACTSIRPPG